MMRLHETNSFGYFNLRGNFKNSQIVFTVMQKGRIAFLGGSITTMSWVGMVCEHIQKIFPQTEFDFINAGIPSMGSTPDAFRLTRDVFSRGKVDMLFVDAAVNDSINGRTSVEQIRAMEGIVRQSRRINPEIDIVFIYFADPEKIKSYSERSVPDVIKNHENVAKHYSISSINLALEVFDRIDHDEFSWEEDFKDLHPSMFGQTIYAHSISRFLDAAWHDGITENGKVEANILPAPIDSLNYDRPHLIEIKEAIKLNGFTYKPKWRNGDNCDTRLGFVDVPMLIGEKPGDSFVLKFDGNIVGLWVVAGPDAGIIEYSIDNSDWQKLDLFTKWSKNLHIPWLYILNVQLTNHQHVLTIHINSEKNPFSHGYACRIAIFVVNGE